jgi:hypothetical protein
VVFLDHKVDLCLVFKEDSILFSKVVLLTFPPAMYESSFFPHPHQHLLLVVFFMIAILKGVRWNLRVVLTCISFMAKDSEHFFMCIFGHLDFFL